MPQVRHTRYFARECRAPGGGDAAAIKAFGKGAKGKEKENSNMRCCKCEGIVRSRIHYFCSDSQILEDGEKERDESEVEGIDADLYSLFEGGET